MTLNTARDPGVDKTGAGASDAAAAAQDGSQSQTRVPAWHGFQSIIAPVREQLARRLASPDLRAVLTGATHVMAIRLAGAVLAYVMAIFLARWLGSFEFGIYAYVWVWVLIVAVGFTLGYPSAALRFLPDYFARAKWGRLHGFLRESTFVAIGIGSIGGAIGAAIVLGLRGWMEPYYVAPFLIGLTCVPAAAMLIQLESTSRAFGWLQLAYTPNYIVRPLLLMAIVYALFALGLHPTAIEAVWALVITCIAAAAGQWLIVNRAISRIVPDVKPVRHTRHWTTISLSFVTIDGFRQILENTDVLMIGHLLDPSAVATYYAAQRTGALIAFIYFAVVALAAPRFVKIHLSGSREEMQRFVSGIIHLMFWPSAAAAAALALLGPTILSLFGSDFASGYPALLIVLVGLVVRSATGPVEYMLNMTGHHRDTMRVYGILAVCCIALNYVLIPRLGIAGAALSSYTAIAGTNIVLAFLVYRRLGITPLLGFSAREKR
jgi:O-antigen/teichoic acid export membrane protein